MMSALATSNSSVHNRPWRAWLQEARYECLRLWRTPSFSLPILLFPAGFYLLFGVLLNRGNPAAATYLLATYGVFGTMGVSLFGFGAVVAEDRDRGLLLLKRALPMPRGAYLAAKLVMALLFSSLVAVLLAGLAIGLAGVSLQPSQWFGLMLTQVLGALPFAALGLWLGSRLSGASAVAVINLVYLPMAFLSGLWLPLSMLPDVFRTLAPLWPSWHLAQIALARAGLPITTSIWLHLAVLIALTAAFLFLALRRLARS